MSSRPATTMRRPARGQCGFTLIELMVTVAIALFLLGGLLTILQNVRATYGNQQALAQLQDQQRFAMTVLTDVIQAGGYFPDPVGMTITSALPAAGAYQAGQAFTGTQGAGGPDSIGVRYRTANGDGVILCDGSINTGPGVNQLYANLFTVVPPAAGAPGQLLCTLNGNPRWRSSAACRDCRSTTGSSAMPPSPTTTSIPTSRPTRCFSPDPTAMTGTTSARSG